MRPCAGLINIVLAAVLVWGSAAPSGAANRGLALTASSPIPAKALGTYHALIVGINAYQEWNPLQTAVRDATALRDVLVTQYGFDAKNVLLRTDREATRGQIIRDLRSLASGLTETDNLLIYFAGHGQLDDLTGDGYWIPGEGRLKDPSTWISHAEIKGVLGSEKVLAKNVVVIADSCYSGTLLRGGPSLLKMEDRAYLDKLAEAASRRSRQVITSGGIEPVADGGRDGHSLFAYYLITALRNNDHEAVDLENLFHTRVWEPVTQIGGQRPNVGRLKTPMDEDGQFVLVNRGLAERKAALAAAEEARSRDRDSARIRGEAEEQRRIEEERARLDEDRRRLEEERRLLEERKQLEAERRSIESEKHRLALEAEQRARVKEPPPAREPVQPTEAPLRTASLPSSKAISQPGRQKTTIAVLPWHFYHAAIPTGHITAQYTYELIAHDLFRDPNFHLTHSCYPLKGLAGQEIEPITLSREEDEDLWTQKGFFSSIQLNTEAAALAGRKIGVDLVLMLRVETSTLDTDISACLVETRTGKIFTGKQSVNYMSYGAAVVPHTRRQLQAYMDQASRP